MHSVDSFFPPIEKSGVPNAHAALAVLENNALRTQGGKALVEPMQNHSTHFDVHMQDAMQHIQSVMPQGSAPQQGPMAPPPNQSAPPTIHASPGGNPIELLIHLENAGPHMTQHLQMLSGDPTRKDEVKQKQKQLDMIGKVSDKLHQNVTEAMGAMADQMPNGNGQQAPDPAMVKVQGDLALKAHKQQFDMGMKQRKADHSEQISDKKTGTAIQRETIKTKAQIQREDAKAKTTIKREAAKAATGIGRETAKTRSSIANQTAATEAAIENQKKKAAAAKEAQQSE